MSEIWIRLILAMAISMITARRAYTKGILDLPGAFSAFLIMAVQIAAGERYCVMMFACIFISTSNNVARKKNFESRFESPKPGPRNWKHVFCNEITAAVMVLVASYLTKWEAKCLDSRGSSILVTTLVGGIIGHYSCCFRDTWAADLWVLGDARSPQTTILMGKIQKVTTIASGIGVGMAFVFQSLLTDACSIYAAFKLFLILPLSVLAEHCAIMTHSRLTTKLHFRGYCLVRKKVVWKQGPAVLKISGFDIFDNDTINFLSLLVSSILIGLVCSCLF